MKANWLIANDSTVIASIQKNGSTSMTSILTERTNGERALTFENRVAFIRHPLERLGSFARMVKVRNITWHNVVDEVLSKTNVHWVPQINLLKWDNKLIPNILHRFEDVNDHWLKYSSHALPCMNETLKEGFADYDAYRLRELRDYYREDIDLWCSIP